MNTNPEYYGIKLDILDKKQNLILENIQRIVEVLNAMNSSLTSLEERMCEGMQKMVELMMSMNDCLDVLMEEKKSES